jgi:hypothetical protein
MPRAGPDDSGGILHLLDAGHGRFDFLSGVVFVVMGQVGIGCRDMPRELGVGRGVVDAVGLGGGR